METVLVVLIMLMVEVDVDMVTGLTMDPTLLAYHTWVDHNHLVTNKITMHTGINHTVLGVLEEMDHNSVTVVLEDVKVW